MPHPDRGRTGTTRPSTVSFDHPGARCTSVISTDRVCLDDDFATRLSQTMPPPPLQKEPPDAARPRARPRDRVPDGLRHFPALVEQLDARRSKTRRRITAVTGGDLLPLPPCGALRRRCCRPRKQTPSDVPRRRRDPSADVAGATCRLRSSMSTARREPGACRRTCQGTRQSPSDTMPRRRRAARTGPGARRASPR